MADRTDTEPTDMVCSCGEKHKGHICWLTHMGLLNEVYYLTCNPTVSCAKCGARANQPHNVCFPTSPEGHASKQPD